MHSYLINLQYVSKVILYNEFYTATTTTTSIVSTGDTVTTVMSATPTSSMFTT